LQESGFGKEKCPRADGTQPAHLTRLAADPTQEFGVRTVRVDAQTAGDEQSVDATVGFCDAPIGIETQPRGRPKRPPPEPDDIALVPVVSGAAAVPEPAGGAGEDLQRPHDVQDLNVREGEHGDPLGTVVRGGKCALHASSMAGWPPGSNANIPSISAM